MSYELRKPITEKEKCDFIVEYNHQQGLRIKDTEMFLFALEQNEIMGEKEIEIDVPDYETVEKQVEVNGEIKTVEVMVQTGTHKETIIVPYPVLNPEWNAIELEQAKEAKIAENDNARDEALNQGVVYKEVLFDSDTDQKVNLLAIVSTMDDEQTITWFGKDNQPLECNKEDLINIGGLITQLHSFCWNKNAEIKEAISEAETKEEVEAIVINYELGE